MSLFQGLSLKKSFGLVAAILIIAGFTPLFVGKAYLDQIEVHRLNLRNFKQHLEKRASAVSYFILERQHDLENMAESREISVFFENKALGMSMLYGLKGSLEGIQTYFDRQLIGRRLGNEPIYSRLVFIDSSGKCLVDTQPPDQAAKDPKDWRTFLTPDRTQGTILPYAVKGSTQLIVSLPYFYKGVYDGQLMAFIFMEPVQKNLLMDAGESSNLNIYLYSLVITLICRPD